jgi:carbonic anhydrase
VVTVRQKNLSNLKKQDDFGWEQDQIFFYFGDHFTDRKEKIMNRKKITVIAIAITVLFTAVGTVFADSGTAMTAEAQAAVTPSKAIGMLRQGNARFIGGSTVKRDLLAQVSQTSKGQYPFAAVVSCLDSRVPPEFVFDQGIGDLFVARVAGNFVNDDILGSLEYAAKVAGAKLILIMGHTECGAVKGACDGAQLGLLTAALANINPAVEAVKGDYTPRDSKNAKFVQAVTEMNVRLNMQKLRERSLVLREMLDKGEIEMVGAIYDVSNGRVAFWK